VAMSAAESLAGSDIDWRVLATDISANSLARAQTGAYRASELRGLSAGECARHMLRQDDGEPLYLVRPAIKERITFRRYNLASVPTPLKGPLDAIFCRNTLMYLHHEVRVRLAHELARLLADDGLLFIGHAETLTGLTRGLRPLKPSIFVRADAAKGGRDGRHRRHRRARGERRSRRGAGHLCARLVRRGSGARSPTPHRRALHYLLPASATAPAKAASRPAMFADTGVPLLFKTLYARGCVKKDLVVRVAGAAKIYEDNGTFDIGRRNYLMLAQAVLEERHLRRRRGRRGRVLAHGAARGGHRRRAGT